MSIEEINAAMSKAMRRRTDDYHKQDETRVLLWAFVHACKADISFLDAWAELDTDEMWTVIHIFKIEWGFMKP